ncbi:MAG: YdcF family protein [Rickettsiaceae bacterium]|jgi:uncharacterized SAM-binding protein YcdF (DUF218 family)|nr:YdcF family protein [Rickettsiaceae bacterium]
MSKLITTLLFLLLTWAAGLGWFICQIPFGQPVDETTVTDAVVALTGGVNRVEEGIKLLLDNRSKRLFISGVGSPKYLRSSLKIHDMDDKIVFGTKAKSTYENAKEVSDWVKKHQLKSIRLVTANYHMPRATMLIKALNPELLIVEHPVFPKAFNVNKWRQSPVTVKLLFLEYNKYITLRLSLLLGVKIESLAFDV